MDPTLDLRRQQKEEELLLHDQWAMKHANLAVKDTWNKMLDEHRDQFGPGYGREYPPMIEDGQKLPRAPQLKTPVHAPMGAHPHFKIGIIGAGAAGLFTALIFDWLQEQSNNQVEFEYEILEASQRVGGRLYTHNFSETGGPHDYYDVGAMRFPENKIMKRLFDLFRWLGMKKSNLKEAKPADLVPYYLSGKTEPWSFNDITKWGNYETISAESADPWGINADMGIDQMLLKKSPEDIFEALTGPLRTQLQQDLEQEKPSRKGWDMLMEYDNYSTRSFLLQGQMTNAASKGSSPTIPLPPYNYQTVQWMEAFNGGSGWYDQAFSEAVLESLDFQYSPSTKWWCILGGAEQLAVKMADRLKTKPSLCQSSRVTKIEAAAPGMKISVNSDGSTKVHDYDTVFSTVPFGCLRHMDTSKAKLSYPVKQAMRTLSYGPSAKVGIKFKRAWWIHDLGDNSITKAGLGHSDLNIRTCVYPSYNIEDTEGTPAVLLCSYTWQQDALRLTPLISTNPDPAKKMHEEEELKKIVFRDLARMHACKAVPEAKVYELIETNYESHHAFDWDQNPDSVGAFAFFGPQQFRSSWGNVIQPQGDLYIVGEAASPHHAWVVGALESSVHAVHSWLLKNAATYPDLKPLADLLEKDGTDCPFQGLPPYMEKNTSQWHAVLSLMHSQAAGIDDIEIGIV
ncbi:amino-acid oxidase [Penicillium cf. griseofulvum]|uniref:Amino-acid oxidase n=1 Tax=Penicillium cf. griseofulvum TaxID=2972120 RepID=A0A9W9MZU1_9EURO|nr:amino-acid oxidase [Penicillium cf. griseofulvum]KAJ5421987.1 amino-acid oxidase [Penicillium cf. griseofulvum]